MARLVGCQPRHGGWAGKTAHFSGPTRPPSSASGSGTKAPPMQRKQALRVPYLSSSRPKAQSAAPLAPSLAPAGTTHARLRLRPWAYMGAGHTGTAALPGPSPPQLRAKTWHSSRSQCCNSQKRCRRQELQATASEVNGHLRPVACPAAQPSGPCQGTGALQASPQNRTAPS